MAVPDRYAAIPAYANHVARMGVKPIGTLCLCLRPTKDNVAPRAASIDGRPD